MRVTVFSSQTYDKEFFIAHIRAISADIDFDFQEAKLTDQTAILAKDADAILVFVNDHLDRSVIDQLISFGIKHVALRCAGYNNVDVEYAKEQGMSVSRVPAYSPQAVAEHTIALMMSLNRKLHKAYNRVKESNFDLNGLLGFTLHHKKVGVIGTGKIGQSVVNILQGFGCDILCYDIEESEQIKQTNAQYTSLESLVTQSDIITLHCPLTPETEHLINDERIEKMKEGVMIINTSRGKLIDTKAVIKGIKSKKIGYLGLDVYEQEEDLFFKNRSSEIIDDDVFQRLLTFPNVLITGHQGFFTQEALEEIAETSINNLLNFNKDERNESCFLC
uniref:2-hydroxyacid dehydrogenase n=1 Tax=Ningiella ruwaisensis TaxID=2364274 RepID=UPI00109FE10A|nr:2-hydroxyacid dehydrogenase [Ningiella ruwaisensis]